MTEQNPEDVTAEETEQPEPFTLAQVHRLDSADVVQAVGVALAGTEGNEYDAVVHNRRAQAAVNAVIETVYVPPADEPTEG